MDENLKGQLKQLTCEFIKQAATNGLTGQEAADFVYNGLADLDNGIPVLGLIPDGFEVGLMKGAVNKMLPHLKGFIETCYQEIKADVKKIVAEFKEHVLHKKP